MANWWETSDALHDVLVEIGRLPQEQRTFAAAEVRPGWLVLDNELERVGVVDSWVDDYVVVRHGFWQRLYIPTRAVGLAHRGAIVLNLPRSWIPTMGWGSAPRRPGQPAHGGATPSGHGRH